MYVFEEGAVVVKGGEGGEGGEGGLAGCRWQLPMCEQ